MAILIYMPINQIQRKETSDPNNTLLKTSETKKEQSSNNMVDSIMSWGLAF